jgi:hypothetical protein
MINKSLLTLGLVINKLSEGAQLNGVPAVSCSPVHSCPTYRNRCTIEGSWPCKLDQA